jgi:hypothetical protein
VTGSRARIGPQARDRAGRPLPHLGLAGAAFLLVTFLETSAEAAHCPRGQLWMIHARQCVDRRHRKVAPDPEQKKVHLPEQPSHKGIVYVHVVQPPDPPPPPPAPKPAPPLEIPYTLPSSIMSRAYSPPQWRVP